MIKERLPFLDIAKGFGITFTILGHNSLPPLLYDWIYAFHMPLFFIISGYLWKEKTLKLEVNKGIKQLLFPLIFTKIIWTFLLLIAYNYRGFYTGPDVNIWLNGALFEMGSFQLSVTWFLLALFWGKILMCLLQNIGEKNRIIIVIVCFCFSYFLRPFLMQGYGTSFPCNIFQGMTVPVFLLIGYYLHKYNIFDKKVTFPITIVFTCSLLLAFKMPLNMGALYYPNLFWNILSSSLITIVILFFSRELYLLGHNSYFVRILLFVGRNSLAVLCIHALEFSLRPLRFLPSCIPSYLHGLIAAVSIFCLVYIFRKVLFIRKVYHIS